MDWAGGSEELLGPADDIGTSSRDLPYSSLSRPCPPYGPLPAQHPLTPSILALLAVVPVWNTQDLDPHNIIAHSPSIQVASSSVHHAALGIYHLAVSSTGYLPSWATNKAQAPGGLLFRWRRLRLLYR